MTERYYTDGTEPTVLPHFDQRDIHPMRVCRGVSCNQGRRPCAHPDLCGLAAEASTEVGDEPAGVSHLERLLVGIVLMVSIAAVVGFVAGVLT